MKKFLSVLVVAMIATASVNAQFTIGGGLGYSSKGKFASELAISNDFGPVFIKAGMLNHLSTAIKHGTTVHVSLGHSVVLSDVLSLEPSLGYGYVLRSNDIKGANGTTFVASLYLVKDLPMSAQLFTGANYTDKAFIGTIGLRMNFGK